MREFNLLDIYPQPEQPRYVGPDIRTIENRIVASYRDHEYYDGDRKNGYGGFKYDGRWQPIAERIVSEYNLTEDATVLQIGPEKGFLLHDLAQLYPQLQLTGYELSKYAIEHAMPTVQQNILQGEYKELPFADDTFDFVIAIGVVYTLNLADAISCLKEIQRVGKGKSFITLGAFTDEQSEKLFKWWSLLGSTILHVEDWKKVLEHAGYTGDYHFVTADYLNLKLAQ